MLLLELLKTAGGFLLKLLTARSLLLLQLGGLGLVFLLEAGHLAPGLLQHLFALLATLLPQFRTLPLRFLANAGATNQGFALAAGLVDDFLSLLAGLIQESFALPQQLSSPLQFAGQGLAHGVEHINGIPFVDQAATREGNTCSLEHDFFELIKLFKNLETRLAHCSPLTSTRRLNNLRRSIATVSGTRC